ncbi:MAG: nicotinate (nicotinamide) nucleotide adenylyltransferase [candidate division WOR-3 bacterium]
MKNPNLSFGIFGGLFDPPHIGHLILSQWVLEEFALDRIIFIPAFNPPHKRDCASFHHRWAMTKLAIQANKKFLLSAIEKKIKGKSYTFKVIKELKKVAAFQKGQFYLIIGADQWNEINKWRHPELIFDETKVIVVPRPHHQIKKIQPFYRQILISNAPLIDISSTLVRSRIQKGLSIEYLVLPGVADYIIKNKLYTS